MRPEVILFDEPCSARDPISTAKIEELIDELKENYTIAIVTHNMQQAARVSDSRPLFMYLGELIEFGETKWEDFHLAGAIVAPAGLYHPGRLRAATRQRAVPVFREETVAARLKSRDPII